MTRRRMLIASSALLVAAVIWLGVSIARPVKPYANLQYVSQSAGTFSTTNLSNRPIHIVANWIEEKDANGWHRYTNVATWKTLDLGPFESGYFSVEPPQPPAKWRLHVWVSADLHGPETLPYWFRYYADRRNSPRLQSLGWKVWKWPPLGSSIKVTLAGKAFQINSQEVDPIERTR